MPACLTPCLPAVWYDSCSSWHLRPSAVGSLDCTQIVARLEGPMIANLLLFAIRDRRPVVVLPSGMLGPTAIDAIDRSRQQVFKLDLLLLNMTSVDFHYTVSKSSYH